MTITPVRRRHAVARVRGVRQVSTPGAVQTRLTRARVEAGTPLSVISRRACAEETTSGRRVVAGGGVEAQVGGRSTRIVAGVAARPVVAR